MHSAPQCLCVSEREAAMCLLLTQLLIVTMTTIDAGEHTGAQATFCTHAAVHVSVTLSTCLILHTDTPGIACMIIYGDYLKGCFKILNQ